VIEVVAEGVPAGLGAPIYGKLDAGHRSRADVDQRRQGRRDRRGLWRRRPVRRGERRRDAHGDDGHPVFLSNKAGGILGGISTGQAVVARFAVKPTSSILIPRRSVDRAGQEIDVSTKGRHDPCVGIRAVPVGEAMLAIVLADHYLRHRGQIG
jgi:chorismate synthase